MVKLENGKLAKSGPLPSEDWAPIKVNRCLKIEFIRKEIPPDKSVRYLKETISCPDEDLGKYFIKILIGLPPHPLEIPLDILCLNSHQQEELILHGLVPRDYFNKLSAEEDGYYLKEELIHEEDDDF